MELLNGLSGSSILVTGAAGMLGRAFVDACAELAPGARVLGRSHAELDVTDRAAVLSIQSERPDWILHCAADVNADRCEDDEAACRRVQVGGTENVIALARETGARILYPQSFLIFGEVDGILTEDTPPGPLSAYGRCKLEAEQAIAASGVPAVVVRMGGFFGGDDADKNFVGKFVPHVVKQIASGASGMDVGDRVWQPTYTVDLARNALMLAERGAAGVYHMACHGHASFHDLAVACVEELNLQDRFEIRRVDAAALAGRDKARRPLRAIMENRRLAAEGLDQQRPWRQALAEYLRRPHFTGLAATAAATSR